MSEAPQCDFCGLVMAYGLSDDEREAWLSATMGRAPFIVEIVLCPLCAGYPADTILEGYKARIRRGENLRYH